MALVKTQLIRLWIPHIVSNFPTGCSGIAHQVQHHCSRLLPLVTPGAENTHGPQKRLGQLIFNTRKLTIAEERSKEFPGHIHTYHTQSCHITNCSCSQLCQKSPQTMFTANADVNTQIKHPSEHLWIEAHKCKVWNEIRECDRAKKCTLHSYSAWRHHFPELLPENA